MHTFSGTCLSCFRSYFTNRRQSVATANRISSTKQLHYGVPQGSNQTTFLRVHLFADDIQIETSILPQHVHSAISSVETCISDVKHGIIENKLQLNDEKTEYLLIRPSKCTNIFSCTTLSFGHDVISFSTTAKNIGFHFTDDRTDAHVQDICRKVDIDIRRISSIRHILSIDATKTLICAFVLPKLDYCNSLFYGSPMHMLEGPQKAQNSAARLIFQCRKQNHISPLLMYLHRLPINVSIEYKLSDICHSSFLGLSPICLSDLLLVHTPHKNLRSSSDNRILCIHKLLTNTFGHRSFPFAAPTIWNSFLQCSDILILSINLCWHQKLIFLGNYIHDA